MDNLYNLAAEIAERLDEMEDERVGSGVELIAALAAISASSRIAWRICLQHMHNAPERYLSYVAQAERRGVSKQAMHAEFHRHLDHIRAHMPTVAEAIMEMRDNVGHAHGPRSQSVHRKSAGPDDRVI